MPHAPIVFEPLALLRLDLVPQRHVLELVRLAGLVLAVEAEQAVGESHVDVGRRDRLPRHKDLFAPLRPDEGWSGGHCCLWSARKVERERGIGGARQRRICITLS